MHCPSHWQGLSDALHGTKDGPNGACHLVRATSTALGERDGIGLRSVD